MSHTALVSYDELTLTVCLKEIMVSVSTTAKVGSRHPDRLVWWFFHFGHLKVLLGKPGTLHSPGHIFPSAMGVPLDLRDASGF